MPPPSVPCSTGCSITDTCLSAVREVGAPKPNQLTPRRTLDEQNSKSKLAAGQKPPGGFRVLDPGTSALELHPRIPGKTKPSARPTGSSVDLQRVQHGQFFGANSVASALDLRLERDPEANRSTLSPLHIRTDVNPGLRSGSASKYHARSAIFHVLQPR